MNRTGNSSFTLIEMLMVILIVGVVAVITLRSIVFMSDACQCVLNRTQAGEEAVSALERMRREIRSLTSNVTADSSEWAFINAGGTTNNFRRSGSTLLFNNNVLAANVNEFTLTYYNSTNGVLTPVPLTDTNMAHIRRVAMDLRITRGNESSQLNVNFFCPRAGTVK